MYSGEYAGPDDADGADGLDPASILEADARTRTADPFITSEVLYQLSYVGAGWIVASSVGRGGSVSAGPSGIVTRTVSP